MIRLMLLNEKGDAFVRVGVTFQELADWINRLTASHEPKERP